MESVIDAVLPSEGLPILEETAKPLETSCNSSSSYDIKKEDMDDVQFNLDYLHHSIDIKEDYDIEQLLTQIFECAICGYQVSQKRALIVHLRAHTDIDEHFEGLEEQEFEVADNSEMDWTTYSSSSSKKILPRAWKKYPTKTSQLANKKLSFLKYQRECFKREHDVKRSFLKYRRECFEKEHELQMELLIRKNELADQKLLLNTYRYKD